MTDTHNLIHHGETIVASGALPFFCSLRSFAGVQRRMEMRRVARKKPKEAPIRKRNRHSNEPNGRGCGVHPLPRSIRHKIVSDDCETLRERERDYIYPILLIIHIICYNFIKTLSNKFQCYFVLFSIIAEKSASYFRSSSLGHALVSWRMQCTVLQFLLTRQKRCTSVIRSWRDKIPRSSRGRSHIKARLSPRINVITKEAIHRGNIVQIYTRY